MYEYTLRQWIFLFIFYCILGWILESTYVSVRTKKLTNRGFMRGPWLPIYGCGFVGMLLISGPFRNNMLILYIAGTIGGSVLELITGEAMEAIFKVRYWDYSYRKYNFRGQICLPNSLYWGFLAIALNAFIQRYVELVLFAVPLRLMIIIDSAVGAIIIVDFIKSVKSAIDMMDILYQLDKAKNEMQILQKRLDVVIAVASDGVKDEVDELKIKAEVLKERIRGLSQIRDFDLREMIKGNPTMVSKKFQGALDTIKETVYSRRNKEE